MSEVTLHQFPFSHYNEKVRWALTLKGVEHRRESYLPGPHMVYINRLSGQTQTPVLAIGDAITAGSTEILRLLDQKYPDSPLFPTELENEVVEEVSYFDEVVGPATRTVLFSVLINHGGYLTSMFGQGKPAWKRSLYTMTFPLVRGVMAKGNGVNDENIARSREIAQEAMDRISSRTAETGYLVGDSFTAADLVAAALMAPLANPDHPDMSRPQPVPADMQTLLNEFSSHPAIDWVQKMYREHRP